MFVKSQDLENYIIEKFPYSMKIDAMEIDNIIEQATHQFGEEMSMVCNDSKWEINENAVWDYYNSEIYFKHLNDAILFRLSFV